MSTNVATKIEEILARCDRIRRGSAIDRPTRFDAEGEAHARSVAAADLGKNRQRSATTDLQSDIRPHETP